jgi:hypothetical protein
LTIPFTVPSNGVVDIDVQIYGQVSLAGSAGGAILAFGLFQHGTSTQIGTTEHAFGWGVVSTSAVGPIIICNHRFHLAGLTPGSLTLDLAGAVTSGASAGAVAAQGYTGNPNTSNVSPAIIQAFASV